MTNIYEAMQTWLLHGIEQGMKVSIVSQQKNPNGSIRYEGDVSGTMRAQDFRLTFRPVEDPTKPCSRSYKKSQAYTVRVINGKFCCPSCSFPCEDHK